MPYGPAPMAPVTGTTTLRISPRFGMGGVAAACVAWAADKLGGLVLGRASSYTVNGERFGVRIHRLTQPEDKG